MGINVLKDSKSSPRRIWYDSPWKSDVRCTYRSSQHHKYNNPRGRVFDDFDIVENILLLHVGISTLNVILANISEKPIEITDIS